MNRDQAARLEEQVLAERQRPSGPSVHAGEPGLALARAAERVGHDQLSLDIC